MWLVISNVPDVTSPTWNADLFLFFASLLNPQVYSHMGEFDIIAIGFPTSSRHNTDNVLYDKEKYIYIIF